MTTSIIIPLLDRHDLTVNCLAAIEANTPEPHEVILVDNGSTDATRDLDVSIRNPRNRGFAVACNQGARAATGDVLVFLNNDTEVQSGWLHFLHFGLRHRQVVQPLLMYPDGTVQCAGIRVDFSEPPGSEAVNLKDPVCVGAPYDVDACCGACLAIYATDFPGFDTGYLNGYEDVDLCIGLTCAVVPWSLVIHHESQSAGRFDHAPANIARLRAKWGNECR